MRHEIILHAIQIYGALERVYSTSSVIKGFNLCVKIALDEAPIIYRNVLKRNINFKAVLICYFYILTYRLMKIPIVTPSCMYEYRKLLQFLINHGTSDQGHIEVFSALLTI